MSKILVKSGSVDKNVSTNINHNISSTNIKYEFENINDYIDYVSVWEKFVDENDCPIMEYFKEDHIHITPEAYLLFKEVMEDKLLKK